MHAKNKALIVIVALWGFAHLAQASQAPGEIPVDVCRPWGIAATAEVVVSDGSSFRIESTFQNVDTNAITHIREDSRGTIAVDGAFGWVEQGSDADLGGNFHKLFALGHQFHAFLLHFDELTTNPRAGLVELHGTSRTSRVADYPYGGLVHLIAGDTSSRPWGFQFAFPERPPIWVALGDWRDSAGRMLPFEIEIDDGERTFMYRYTDIAIDAGHVEWYFQQVLTPPLDEVAIHRLHRSMLAAHCDGDAQRLAQLTAPTALSINRGEISVISPGQMSTRFEQLFNTLTYDTYIDLVTPKVTVADSADIGWAAVQVRAVGGETHGDGRFDDQWAWLMLAKKVDGVWTHAGNASNRK